MTRKIPVKSPKSLLILLSIISVVEVLDVTMVRVLLSIGPNYPLQLSTFVFIFLFVLFSLSSVLIIRWIPSMLNKNVVPFMIKQRVLTQHLPLASVFINVLLLAVIVGEMEYYSKYHTSLVDALIFASSVPSAIILLSLILKFISWIRNKHDYGLILYVLAMFSILLNNTLIVIYFNYQISAIPLIRKATSIQNIITDTILPPQSSIVLTMSVTSSLSFILTWIATAFLLRNYSKRVGRFLYWFMVTLPLLYFIGDYRPIFSFVFSTVLDVDPITYSRIFTILFGLTRTVGGIFFAVGFWIIAGNIRTNEVREYLRLSGFGIMLFFVSTQIGALVLVPYPPFGSVAISGLGLASILTFLGLYLSAISVSKDTQLRAQITKKIQQADLLGKIGQAEMEEDLLREVKPVIQRLSEAAEEPSISYDDLDIRSYVNQVLEEVKRHPD